MWEFSPRGTTFFINPARLQELPMLPSKAHITKSKSVASYRWDPQTTGPQSTRQHLMPGLGAVPLAEGAKVAEEAKEGRVELQIIQLGTSTDLGEMWIFFKDH